MTNIARWRAIPLLAMISITILAPSMPMADARQTNTDAGETVQPGGTLAGDPGVTAIAIASGFVDPVNVANAGDGSGRLFVVERGGTIVIVDADGARIEAPFLDASGDIESGGMEQGLLGLAFHPDYEANGRLFIYYTAANGGAMTLAEYAVSSDDSNRADEASGRVLLQIEDPYRNHNGGDIAFGPDGYLYLGIGDGGGSGDPDDNGQNLGTLLGTILRIDVDGDQPYAIPGDNPFIEDALAAPEIFAYGLRNPWQINFDAATGDLYVADVGQNAWEEISLIPAGTSGQNFGWPVLEGSHCFRVDECEPIGELPIAEYSHSDTGGCSVIGIGVARSEQLTSVDGVYFAADWCSGKIYALGVGDDGARVFPELHDTSLQILGGGEGEDGALCFTSESGGEDDNGLEGGVLWKIVEADSLTGEEITVPLD